jgi:hypothetical protein
MDLIEIILKYLSVEGIIRLVKIIDISFLVTL